ncbi:MAG: DUF362 domain-containing protein [Ignavibacteriales bacterium]|nr:DUF362 domain-containing protein [Ignavibacteriales bacterium]
MSKNISRRNFLKSTSLLGFASILGIEKIFPKYFQRNKLVFNGNIPDLVAVKGEDIFNNTIKAINELGGMRKFVKNNSVVGLLINSDFDLPGAYVHPDISLAVLKMCHDAGAKEIWSLQNIKPEYWQRSSVYEEYKYLLEELKILEFNQVPAEYEEKNWIIYENKGKSVKEFELVKKIFEIDTLINIPIAKHHMTTFLTCCLKNMMGVNTRASNVKFHLDGPSKNDPEFLAQSIVDLNKIRKSDLCVVDATKFIVTNGPNGPGRIITKDTIVVGKDIVAVDSYCSNLLGYEVDEILTTKIAYQEGLGEIDLSKLTIKNIVK